MTEILRKVDVDEIDKAPIVEVDGVKGRLIPLRVRGLQRRQVAGFADEEQVTVALQGVYKNKGSATVALTIIGEQRGLQDNNKRVLIPVLVNGKTMLSIEASQIERKAERRSGAERRKVER